ncbi:N-6 DNA methylase [Amycolatopsis speibonae]|uniref:N-6 DNA methylase n=1 Tax=Amycolatopsis speibonae TaxID=1450224 RepID=A0ABV7NWY2_9PSEU
MPTSPYGDDQQPLHVDSGYVWAPLRDAWLLLTPEEEVRQQFIYRLVVQYGFQLDQMAQERRTQRGRSSSRADLVVARDAQALKDNRDYLMVAEVKSDNVSIDVRDYAQGESYARAVNAEFLVCLNNRDQAVFRLTPGAPGDRIQITRIPSAADLSDPARLESVRRATKAFTRDEFQRLLHDCHSILRDNHKMDPGAAFDEISKILFIKMAYERTGKSEVFTTEKIRKVKQANLIEGDGSEVLEQLFSVTKGKFAADDLFSDDDRIKVSYPTFERIVRMLERFNLSRTGDDIKGLAFERFLGATFRGELGQFFTPRPIVDFMVEMLNPREGQRVCDPACGTGGFLIKAFEYIRNGIEADAAREKADAKSSLLLEAKKNNWSTEKLETEIDANISAVNARLDETVENSRIRAVSGDSIFGVDAEMRAARTAKMNMIMHGDGHAGIYYHDGLLDIDAIFPQRFDIVLSNPPFGATVGHDQLVGTTEQTTVAPMTATQVRKNIETYGEEWHGYYRAMLEAARLQRPILELFDVGRNPVGSPMGQGSVRPARATEEVFVERCISLLKPGGKLGIVLPDGILNNPTTAWLRNYVESRAKLLAVVSIPHEVFRSANATVKTSLVFLRKFSDDEARGWEELTNSIANELKSEFKDEILQGENDFRLAEVGGNEALLPLLDELKKLEKDKASSVARLKAARKLSEAMGPSGRASSRKLIRMARAKEDALQAKLERELQERRKARWSYPVFMAEVSSAGITGSGDTGTHVPNELPEVLQAFRDFDENKARFIETQEVALF